MWSTVLFIFLFTIFSYVVKNVTSRSPNPIRFHFNFVLFYFVTSVVAAIIWPIFLLRPKDVTNANIATRIIKNIVGRIHDIKWVLRNGHILAEDRGAVLVSNHQITLDILGMFNVWDEVGKIAAIAKKQLLYIFPFGLCAYLAGVVFIDRNDPKTAYKQLTETSELMVKNKTKIWLFPEGTRNKDYTKLLPFKKGAFTIAVNAQMPIIPVVFSPYYFVNAQKHIFGKGHIIMQALEPIPTVGLTKDNVPDLIAKVHEQMSLAYKELSKEVLNELPVNYPYTNALSSKSPSHEKPTCMANVVERVMRSITCRDSCVMRSCYSATIQCYFDRYGSELWRRATD